MGDITSQYFTAISSDRISTKYDQSFKKIETQSPKEYESSSLIDGIHIGHSISSPSILNNMPGKRRPSFTLNKYDAAPQSPLTLESNKFTSLPPRSPAVIGGASALPAKFLSPKNLKSPPSNLVQYFASASSPATASSYFSSASSVVSEPDSPTVKLFAKNPTSDLLNSFITAESEKLIQSRSPAQPPSPQPHFQFKNPKINRRVSFSDHTDRIASNVQAGDNNNGCNPIFSVSPSLARVDSDISTSIRKHSLEKLNFGPEVSTDAKDLTKKVNSPPPQSFDENEVKNVSRRQSIASDFNLDSNHRKLRSPPPKSSEDQEVGEVVLFDCGRRGSFRNSLQLDETNFSSSKLFGEKLRSPPPRAEDDPENSNGVSHALSRRNSFRRASFLENSETLFNENNHRKLHSPPPALTADPDLCSESSINSSIS